MAQKGVKELSSGAGNAVLECGLCRGTGADPLIGVGRCPVCGGKGTIRVKEPYVQCGYCKGGGIHRDRRGFPRRMTCSVCSGKGVVSVTGETKTCPACQGSGRTLADEFGLPCLVCSGKGVVSA